MHNDTNFLFLLGGYDLEMVEIQKLLEANEVPFLDANLGWDNAIWEAYRRDPYLVQILQALEEDKQVFGIELRGKAVENCGLIDHHNEQQHLPSAIEQVASLLGLKLDRRQQLVAANDKGYIPAMKEMGATQDEIDEIRKADREAQGVTDEEEAEALKSINKSSEVVNEIWIVKTELKKFSPITDYLFGKAEKKIIYNEETLNYYGKEVNTVSSFFDQHIKSGKSYKGGGDEGYFGFDAGKFSSKEISEFKNEIVRLFYPDYGNRLISHHIFLFPFKWRHLDVPSNKPFQEHESLSSFRNKLMAEGTKWNRRKFELTRFDQYNEFNYFYSHVREILYDIKTDDSIENEDLINHFEYQISPNEDLYYCIKPLNGDPYSLKIESILLNIYNTGTGILSFHLRNYKDTTSSDDILRINQFGRRLYPPFFGLSDFSALSGEPDESTPFWSLKLVKEKELADKIWIGRKDSNGMDPSDLCEDFTKYQNIFEQSKYKHRLPSIISKLFPENFLLEKHKTSEKEKAKGIELHPIIDDRMFVICWYANSEISDKLCVRSSSEIHLSEWWYKYVFVDHDDTTCKNEKMFRELIEQSTYNRWSDYGTFFGISRYSFVVLASRSAPLFVLRHVQTLYYKMAELCLIQRATVLSFTDEVTHISQEMLKEKSSKKIFQKIASLYKMYLVFINRIFFKEVTAQDQGIEIYDMIQKNMRINEDVFAIDKQIEELHNYAGFEKENENNELLSFITVVGVIFLPLSLIASLMEWHVLEDFFLSGGQLSAPFWLRIGVVILISCVMIFVMDFITKFRIYSDWKFSKLSRVILYLFFLISGLLMIFNFK